MKETSIFSARLWLETYMERLNVEDVVLVFQVGCLQDEVKTRFNDGLADSDRGVARFG